MQPRIGVKAIVVQGHQLVAVKKRGGSGAIYSFPGGGQERGETLADAVRREFQEEAGHEVEVGELAFVREYIGVHHDYAATEADVHLVDHLFLCTLREPSRPLRAQNPDPDQVDIVWLPVEELESRNFAPRALIPYLVAMARGGPMVAPCYLGDVN
jgi:8-oxo-dGTP pyrophosphatase MutT (NUDIX family)